MTAPAAVAESASSDRRPTVLFVDDEDGVRLGLRTSLRKLRREHDLLFAASGHEALEILGSTPVDLVVSDMRMPGMNGADLLHRVRAEHPTVIRYVLSGEADQDLVMRVMPIVHRWLSKPCDREELSAAIADALRYRALLHDPGLAAALMGTRTLPSPPARYAQILDLLSNPDVSLDEVVAIAEHDPALAAKVLQLANSAFASAQPVVDLRAAVARVGISTFAQLALASELIHELSPTEATPGLDVDALERHASTIGATASRLAGRDDRLAAGVAGLLCHVGLLLEASLSPDRLASVFEAAAASGSPVHAVERDLYGVGHPALAGHLLSVWGLPAVIVLAVAESHEFPSPDAALPLGITDAVRAARLIAQRELDPEAAVFVDPLSDELHAAVDRWCASISAEVPQ